jgi:4'-phosphopantetheinyl transferase
MIDGVHIWRAELDEEGWPAAAELPREEHRRAAGFLRPDAGRRWVAAHWALRLALGRYLDQPPRQIELEAAEGGKPRLRDRSAGLEFSLSHSAGLALVAVTAGRQVGVDVEAIAPREDLVALAERALPAEEAELVRAARPERRLGAFYAAWARHEARLKCLGTGLGGPLPGAEVAVAPVEAGPAYAAAVALTGSDIGPLRCRTLRPG